MKGRNKTIIKRRSPSADFLVCFPSRAHLTLMPKAICSPSRPSEPNNRLHHPHRRHLQLKKVVSSGGGGVASPLPWTKNNNNEMISEPTSPKVTCAGQIKVRHKTGQCKSWQSVMEEIERIHNKNKEKKARSSLVGSSFGFKKEIMQFLTCMRNIRFDFRCFGAFPHQRPDITSDDDDEEDEDDVEEEESSKTMLSKWFMVLQENNNQKNTTKKLENDEEATAVPPPNALLLMRCRSAPAKSWLEDKSNFDELHKEKKKKEEDCGGDERKLVKKTKSLKLLMEEEKDNDLVIMKYESDLYKISTDIAKETWVYTDPLMSSWKC